MTPCLLPLLCRKPRSDRRHGRAGLEEPRDSSDRPTLNSPSRGQKPQGGGGLTRLGPKGKLPVQGHPGPPQALPCLPQATDPREQGPEGPSPSLRTLCRGRRPPRAPTPHSCPGVPELHRRWRGPAGRPGQPSASAQRCALASARPHSPATRTRHASFRPAHLGTGVGCASLLWSLGRVCHSWGGSEVPKRSSAKMVPK